MQTAEDSEHRAGSNRKDISYMTSISTTDKAVTKSTAISMTTDNDSNSGREGAAADLDTRCA